MGEESVSSSFQRARSDDQKTLRAAQILDAARGILHENGHSSSITIKSVAQRAGMARSNIYRYFPCREAILLALLADKLHRWSDEVEAQMRATSRSGGTDLDKLAAVIAVVTASQPLLCHLMSTLPALLSAEDAHTPSKNFMAVTQRRKAQLVDAMHTAAPILSTAQYSELMEHVTVYIIGCWPVEPSPEDFERDLQRAMLLMALGLQALGDPSAP